MQQEIERKFLVINNIYKNGSVSTFYKQGYLCTDASRTVRIRIAGEKGFITIKGITTGCSRTEYEYEIPTADAMTLLVCCVKTADRKKIRYRYKGDSDGKIWEIDEFKGETRPCHRRNRTGT